MSNRPKGAKRMPIYYRDYDGVIRSTEKRLPADEYHYNQVHTCMRQGRYIFKTKHVGNKPFRKLYNCVKHITKNGIGTKSFLDSLLG